MFDISQCYDFFYTEPDTAYFWSGLGINGQNIAADIANNNDGVTLELLMAQHKDQLIAAGFEYDKELDRFLFSSDNYSDWEAISSAYANQASGNVHVVLGENVRSDGVWNTKELPTLSENENVNKIISVDPVTGQNKGVLLDKTESSQNDSEKNTTPSISSSNIESITGGGARAPNQKSRDLDLTKDFQQSGNSGQLDKNPSSRDIDLKNDFKHTATEGVAGQAVASTNGIM